MRRFAAALLIAAIAAFPGACRKQPEGVIKVLVIGDQPRLRDPALGPLTPGQRLLLANVAQGLVAFDASGNIVAGLAERWTVTDDGLSYIFRLAPAEWPDGRKVTAEQVARLLKRQLASRSNNALKDRFGAVDEIVAMTDRVIEVRLVAPRPDLLSLLAQAEMAVIRNGGGTGPFRAAPAAGQAIKLTREIVSPDEDTATREQLLLGGASAPAAINAFASGDIDLVLGGTFADLPLVKTAKLPRNSVRFDPASGLFGLVPARSGGSLDKPEIRTLLSAAIDRDTFISALAVPGLAPRATLLEPGLEGVATPAAPPWVSTRYADRLPILQAQAKRLFPAATKPTIRVRVPQSPGGALLLRLLQRSWGNIGIAVEPAGPSAPADFLLIDEVAPSLGPAWFVRRFRCVAVAVCDPEADALMETARTSPIPAQRYALLGQAAGMIDARQLFIPITAPVRWALVSKRIQGFAGNRYARHTLTGLEATVGAGG